MRFFVALISVFSLAGLALAGREPFPNAMQEGKVPMIKPASWGSTRRPGNQIPHPAVVVNNNGHTAEVAQLTHRPIAGQRVIETGHIAPSVDRPDAHGRKSHIDLNTHHLNLHALQSQPGNHRMNVVGHLPAHELASLKGAVHTARLKSAVANHAAAVGQHKTNLRTVAHQAAAVARQKAAGRNVAQHAAAAARARNARLGHH